MPKIILARAPMTRRLCEPNPLDVTVKSAKGWASMLAPTWTMVRGYKDGTLSEADYTVAYREILKRKVPLVIGHLRLGVPAITFLCYCPDGAFCHTHLLIDLLCEHYPEDFEDGRPRKAQP